MDVCYFKLFFIKYTYYTYIKANCKQSNDKYYVYKYICN